MVNLSPLLHHKVYKNDRKINAQWIVFIHGLGGNSRIWHKQADYFKRDFHVIMIDLPGHFPNPVMEEWEEEYSFKTCAKMIIQILNSYKIERSHFMGISLGSIILHQIIKSYPERVQSAVLGGAVMQFSLFSRILMFFGDIIKFITPYMWIYRLFAHIMMPKKNHAISRKIFIREASKMGKKSFLKWYKLLHNVKTASADIEQYPIPRLYISGSEDHLFIPFLIQHMEKDIHAKLVQIQNCGHVCNIEKSEEFNYYANSFIKQQLNPNSLTLVK